MALFEFTEGQFKPAQLGKPVDSDTLRALLRAIRVHVLELLPRPLFPVAWLSGKNEPPRLIAVDASGQVVCIYVVEHLGSDQMVNVLAKLNEARQLGWNELSELYEGGQAAFRAGVTAFRSSIPNGTPSGPRLIAVAGTVEENLRSAIEVLATSGIEVHEFSLRELSNGRRILQLQSISPTIIGNAQQLTGKRRRSLPVRSRYTQRLNREDIHPQLSQVIPSDSSSAEDASPQQVNTTTEPNSPAVSVGNTTEANSSAVSVSDTAQAAFDKRHTGHAPVARPRIIPSRRRAQQAPAIPTIPAKPVESVEPVRPTKSVKPAEPTIPQTPLALKWKPIETPEVIQPHSTPTEITRHRTQRGEVLNTRGRIPSRRDLQPDSEPIPETVKIAIPRLDEDSPHYTPHGTLIPSRRRHH